MSAAITESTGPAKQPGPFLDVTDRWMRTVDPAIDRLAAGGTVVVIGESPPGCGGWVIRPAEAIQAADVAAMTKLSHDAIGLALSAERCERLGLIEPGEPLPATLPGIAAGEGGSAVQLARTLRVAADPAFGPEAITHGGEVAPLMAHPGGVLEVAGHVEAATDLVRLAGYEPAAGICQIGDSGGEPAAPAKVRAVAAANFLPVVTIAELISFRFHRDRNLRREASARMPSRYGEFQAIGYRSPTDGREHVAMVAGHFRPEHAPLVCIHRKCRFGDALRSLSCDCRLRLDAGLRAIAAEGDGVLVYLAADSESFECQPAVGNDEDTRAAVEVLNDLRLTRIRLLSERPSDALALRRYRLDVVEPVELPGEPVSA